MNRDLNVPSELLASLPNYKTEDVALFMEKVFPAMMKLFREKDVNYNGSWQQRGILSAQLNFERKTDRINAQFYNNTISARTNENISDTLIDNGIYSLMYLFLLYNKLPNVKQEIDQFISKYTTDGRDQTGN